MIILFSFLIRKLIVVTKRQMPRSHKREENSLFIYRKKVKSHKRERERYQRDVRGTSEIEIYNGV